MKQGRTAKASFFFVTSLIECFSLRSGTRTVEDAGPYNLKRIVFEKYDETNVFFEDRRLEKNSYDVRNLGQGAEHRAQGWRERTDISNR